MKKNISKILSIAFLAVASTAFAQNRAIENGNDLYSNLQFVRAAQSFEEGLKEVFYTDAAYKLANCYYQMGDMPKAEFWYGQVVVEMADNPQVHLNYARALQANGKYELAAQQYQQYHKINPLDGLGEAGVKACKKAEELVSRAPSYSIRPLIINSRASDMAPIYYGEGILFASSRDRKGIRDLDNGYDMNNYYDLYTSVQNENGEWGLAELVKDPLNSIYHEGPVAVNRDETVMVITTTNYTPNALQGNLKKGDNKVANLKLMVCVKQPNGTWSKPKDVPFNGTNFSNAHPTFTPDGDYMYFVSDRDEGKGGADIYIVQYKGNNTWDEPTNVEFVNTAGDELFPYADASGDLFFASNGHPGLGGLDVFRAFFNNDKRRFDDIMNLGSPVNTKADDFGFAQSQNGLEGFVSSNRANGFGSDDIYALNTIAAIVRVQVQNNENEEVVEDAEVEVSLDDKVVGKATTNQYGSFVFPFEPNKKYDLTIKADSFETTNYEMVTSNFRPGKTYRKKVGIMPEPMITVKGLIVEDASQLPLRGCTILLYNLSTKEVREVKSDNKGLFVQEVYPDLEYALVGFKNGYEKDSITFKTEGMKVGQTIEKKLSLTGGDRIYSVAFENVYFAYNSAALQGSAKAELNRMVEILKISKDLRVEISAHTDCRGPNDYNLNLSDKRAKSVVNYLVNSGIDRSRLNPKGYGESRPTNECVDGVECSEDKHRKNRRVEFQVMDEDNNVIEKLPQE